MRVSNVVSEISSNKLRHSADVAWEESERSATRIWIEFDGISKRSPLDVNALLLAVFPVAVLHGEARIQVPGRVSPLLSSRLVDVYAWWRAWGLVERIPFPRIECTSSSGEEPASQSGPVSACFLSGGVDSLHMLQQNIAAFRESDDHRIKEAILIRGLDPPHLGTIAVKVYDSIVHRLEPVAAEAKIILRLVHTNIRILDNDHDFYMKQFHGAALASVAHGAINGVGRIRIASTYDVPNMAPWGSHPAIDPNYSTERLSVLHEGISHSRLDKIRSLMRWPTAFDSMRVCPNTPPDFQNCGKCEKCMRTKLEIVAAGAAVPRSFADRTLDPKTLKPITDSYQASCYRDVIAPLKAAGHFALADAVASKLTLFRDHAVCH